MAFCSRCGAALETRVPDGDDRPRAVCPRCATVHYDNPKTVVGCLVEHEGGVLLCRRAIEPGHGRWTIPAGFLELSESLMEGARRETFEEARANVRIAAPHALLDLPHIGQTYALFRASLPDGRYEAGPESLEVRVFRIDEVPWDDLAFPVVHFVLRFWAEDREAAVRHVHVGALRWNEQGDRFDARAYVMEDHIRLPITG